jgi:hypothetical protein
MSLDSKPLPVIDSRVPPSRKVANGLIEYIGTFSTNTNDANCIAKSGSCIVSWYGINASQKTTRKVTSPAEWGLVSQCTVELHAVDSTRFAGTISPSISQQKVEVSLSKS